MHPISVDRIRLLRAIKGTKKDNVDNTVLAQRVYDNLKENEKDHFVSICQNQPNLISFANSKKGKFDNRTSTTLSRYVRRQIGVTPNEVNDAMLESFSKQVTSRILKGKTDKFAGLIKIFRGEELLKFYVEAQTKTYSCMTGAANTEKIRMYAENPTKVCLITTENRGRALLWTCDDGSKFLDYAYPPSSAMAQVLVDWAESKGYAARNGKSGIPQNIKVTVKTTAQYPRLDSLPYANLDEENATAILHSSSNDSVNCYMSNTDGGIYRLRER